MEEYNKAAWEELIARCEDAGVDAFEINFSCPHGMPERKMGMAMGQDCDLLQAYSFLHMLVQFTRRRTCDVNTASSAVSYYLIAQGGQDSNLLQAFPVDGTPFPAKWYCSTPQQWMLFREPGNALPLSLRRARAIR